MGSGNTVREMHCNPTACSDEPEAPEPGSRLRRTEAPVCSLHFDAHILPRRVEGKHRHITGILAVSHPRRQTRRGGTVSLPQLTPEVGWCGVKVADVDTCTLEQGFANETRVR